MNLDQVEQIQTMGAGLTTTKSRIFLDIDNEWRTIHPNRLKNRFCLKFNQIVRNVAVGQRPKRFEANSRDKHISLNNNIK